MSQVATLAGPSEVKVVQSGDEDVDEASLVAEVVALDVVVAPLPTESRMRMPLEEDSGHILRLIRMLTIKARP